MERTSSGQRRRLQSAVSPHSPALEATLPGRNSAPPVQNLQNRALVSLEKKSLRLSDTQRRRLRRKRAKEHADARQMGALNALGNATKTLALHKLEVPRGRPDGPNDRRCQWTSIPRSGDPSGGAAPSGGGLPIRDGHQRSSSRAERFKQFSSQ